MLTMKTITIKKETFMPNERTKTEELKNTITIEEEDLFEIICSKYKNSERRFKEFKKNNTTKEEQSDKNESLSSESYFRALLSQLGFFQQDLINDLSGLSYKDIQQSIDDLDCINDKEVFIIPVFYLDRPETTEIELCTKYESYPEAFKDFICQMGIYLSTSSKSYDIFKSVSYLLERYGSLLLTREYFYEIISLIPAISNPIIPLVLEDLLKYSQLAVLWNQRNTDPYTLKQPIVLDNIKFRNKTIILLTPLRNNIIRVNLYGSETNCGPLIDNMLIPSYLIGFFVCKTIANFYSKASSRLALRQRRIDIFSYIKDIAIKSETTKNGKISSVLSHTYNKLT